MGPVAEDDEAAPNTNAGSMVLPAPPVELVAWAGALLAALVVALPPNAGNETADFDSCGADAKAAAEELEGAPNPPKIGRLVVAGCAVEVLPNENAGALAFDVLPVPTP